jgi:SAM-dependent methyltransferase
MRMRIEVKARELLPKPIQKLVLPIYNLVTPKYPSELAYWKSLLETENGAFDNSNYGLRMLAIAEESDESFLTGKIVADFGCGPKGSLAWAKSASLRIGIDVLADSFADHFQSSIVSHGMIYVKSTEKVIPLPSDFVDVLFTVNAMDHVDCFATMCQEMIRIIKPGGELIGSFNLEGLVTPTEPQRLDEQKIKENLLSLLEIKSYRVSKRGPEGAWYTPFSNGDLSYEKGQPGVLWVRARKPGK